MDAREGLMQLIGVCGNAGSGKDTIADRLVRAHGFVKVSFADPMKRFVLDVFDFAQHQVWGEVEHKNAPDERYVRTWQDGKPVFLTPRHAMQTIGTEWGRSCCEDIWVRYGIRTANRLRQGGYAYARELGLRYTGGPAVPVVIPDVRFLNELDAVRAMGGRVLRVVRPGYDGAVGISGHRSEAEQREIPDSEFDGVIHNTGSLADLWCEVDRFLGG